MLRRAVCGWARESLAAVNPCSVEKVQLAAAGDHTSHAASSGEVVKANTRKAARPHAPATMASGFIGISVIVTLQNPPNTLVHGVVAAVNPQNATLTLQDGASPLCRPRVAWCVC